MAEKLTDRTAKTSNFADADVFHLVDVSDTSQDPAGSSFKSTIGNIYGSYLAPKITSAQIVTNAADTYSVTLADTVSSNHYLFLQTASGDPFVDVTVTSYASPKDGAILVIRLNRAGTDDLSIPGFSAGSGFSAGIYTARYSSSAVSWLPVNYLPLAAVQDFTDLGDVPSAYTGQANKIVKVKNDETGLEFGDAQQGDITTYNPTLSYDTGFNSAVVASTLFSVYGNQVTCTVKLTNCDIDFSLSAAPRISFPIPVAMITGSVNPIGVASVYFNNGTDVLVQTDVEPIGGGTIRLKLANYTGTDATALGIITISFSYQLT
jgi:hypothetical protein